ncbi:hypothetical protein K3495_g6089 [Podosphaera aphanis]|nr:hypothetical protein K3495_g6089 [Podosphaera aphanis]
MSNSDASIDPLLRDIAPATSTFQSTPPLVTAAVVANPLSQPLDYDSSSPYLQHQHQQLQHSVQNTPRTEIRIPHDEGSPHDPKRSRACEACRGLKVRCESDPNNPEAPCKRCTKANRNCVVTAPSRKRQKKTDSRVAELEKKIDALTASLVAQRANGTPINQSGVNEYAAPLSAATPSRQTPFEQGTSRNLGSSYMHRSEEHSRDWKADNESKANLSPLTVADRKRKYADTPIAQAASPGLGLELPSRPFIGSMGGWSGSKAKATTYEYVDVVQRGLITPEIASQLFEFYVEKLSPHMPLVVFPPGTTWISVQKSTPILFLAILDASSNMNFPHLQQLLTSEIMAIYADRIIRNADKSLEIIQALQISTLWYSPPENVEELKVYQLVNIAAVMGIDIGIGRKISPKPKPPGITREQARHRNLDIDPESIEAKRAWLGCYWLCSNASMCLRRPNLIRWSPFIADCVNVLENSPNAFPSDKLLCQWIKSQHIAEKIGAQLSPENPSSLVDTADPGAQYNLEDFEKDMEEWSATVKTGIMDPILRITECVLNLYMHEISLHVDHTVDEENLSSTNEALQASESDRGHVPLSDACVNSLSVCLNSIDGIFETFMSLDIETIRCLPVAHFVRVAYAVVILIKMYLGSSTPNSELSSVIDKDNLKLEQYLDRLMEVFQAASSEERSKSSSKFLLVIHSLKNCFQRHQELDIAQPGIASDISSPTKKEAFEENTTQSNQQRISSSGSRHPNYSPVNTPLQLLSEVATGSSGGNIDPSLGTNLDYTLSNGLEQAIWTVLDAKDFGPSLGHDALFGGLMDFAVSHLVHAS